MQHFHVKTPTFLSRSLEKILHIPVYLKMDAFQPTGSFKIRGLGYACQKAVEKGAKRLICSSGGNAGYAAAYAAARLKVPITVFLSENAPKLMFEKIAAEGADVVVRGVAWDEANLAALEAAKEPGSYYVHPFDHPDIWEGHTSIMTEIAELGIRPDSILVSVGGGGLMLGVLQGLEKLGWQDTQIFTTETHGTASFAKSVKAGKIVTIDKVESIAHSLGAKRIATEALAYTKKFAITPVVVSDKDALNACLRFADDQRVLVEPACGAALAPAYGKNEVLRKARSLLVIVCGGAAVTMDQLYSWQKSLSISS